MKPRGLLVLLRLLALRRIASLAPASSDRMLAGLGIASLAVWALIDRLGAPADARFALYAVAGIGFPILLVLLLAFAIARIARPPLPYRHGLVIVLAMVPLLELTAALIDQYLAGTAAAAAQVGLVLYAVLYVSRALRGTTGVAQPRALLIGLVLLLGYGWFADVAYLSPSLWVAPEAGDDGDETASASVAEPLLFDQQSRLDDALEDVTPSDGAAPEVFFVGFAGVAEQKVFAAEIQLAARVVANRYGSASRQLLLINDRRDLDTHPLATVSGLSYALQGLAQKMDVDRDVLFLALSSHGSSAPELSVSNGSLPLEQVTADNLSSALRDSGIKWRVIVISACYAGAFIESLKGDHTAIIAAADADRTSFGCSDDRDLTYFGEAFYRDALPGADSLQQAFGLASLAISKREQQEDVPPSRPQAFFGAEIAHVLLALDTAHHR
jgi:peptidase C13-like protein